MKSLERVGNCLLALGITQIVIGGINVGIATDSVPGWVPGVGMMIAVLGLFLGYVADTLEGRASDLV